jgi:hypothetical protein
MTTEQAMNILRNACATVVGTLKDHEAIQGALATVEKAIAPKEEKAE